MPLAMEYVNGMKTIVTNDGIAAVISEKSTSLTDPIIRTPTNIRAGAVAAFGMIVITGAMTNDARNSNDVTNAVIPVHPPSAIPVLDSTKTVAVDDPRQAPAVVATASHIMGSFIHGISPFSSSILACLAVPGKVPTVSNIPTREKEMTTITSIRTISTGLDAFLNSPEKSSWKKKLARNPAPVRPD